jgi:predicted RNA-binding Zn ribbon-like protein
MPDEFQLVAGHVALDFANTLDNRYDPARRMELLPTAERFLAFARQSGILTAQGARRLVAQHSLNRIIELREGLHFLFLAVAEKQAPPPTALQTLNRILAEARAAQTLVWEKGVFEWRSPKPVAPLHAIAFAAEELLTSADRIHVRECSADTCRWFFLDRSKNHSRRWCDMKTCGNRAKAQRFHARD